METTTIMFDISGGAAPQQPAPGPQEWVIQSSEVVGQQAPQGWVIQQGGGQLPPGWAGQQPGVYSTTTTTTREWVTQQGGTTNQGSTVQISSHGGPPSQTQIQQGWSPQQQQQLQLQHAVLHDQGGVTGGSALNCFNCNLNLTGYRYILRDEKPFCIKCYEILFAHQCAECRTPIGTDHKDLSYQDKHWHEACFKCSDCKVSLVDRSFAYKDERPFCADCHDNRYAIRCDGCNNIFRAGMKKYEFKGKQYHDHCFSCKVCRQPIGTKTFIPRDQDVVCVPCYEEQYAQRCAKCHGVINKGGITYKNTPFHRECFTCTGCSRLLTGEKFTSREEKPFCSECFAQLFAKKCCRCTRSITGLGTTKFISFDNRHWHTDCFACYKCNGSLVGRGFLVTGNEVLCPNCGRV